MSENTEATVSMILAAGGFEPMPEPPFKGLLCKEIGGGWWMGGVHAAGVYSKHTRMSDATTDDPIQAAHDLVEMANRLAGALAQPIPRLDEIEEALAPAPEAEETPEHPGFESQPIGDEPPSDAPEITVGEEAPTLGASFLSTDPEFLDETHSEADAEAAADDAGDQGLSDSAGSAESSGFGTGERLPGDSDDFPGDDAEALDADFSEFADELAQIELTPPDADPDFGGELLEFEDEVEAPDLTAPAQDRFIGLDDLDRRRSLRIGDTIRYAKTLLPAWSDEQDAALRELRNFAMGVSEKRWNDDPAKREELEALERDARRIRDIEAARDAKVEFLEAASRDEIEAFVLEDGWPA